LDPKIQLEVIIGFTSLFIGICLVGFKFFLNFSAKESLKKIRPEDEAKVRESLEDDPFSLGS